MRNDQRVPDNERREALLRLAAVAAIGAIPLAGCASSRAGSPTTTLPDGRQRRSTNELLARWGRNGSELRSAPAYRQTPGPVTGSPSRLGGGISLPTDLQPRASWARGEPNYNDMDRMAGVQRITVHHDGMNAFTSTSQDAAKGRVEAIRNAHRHGNGWADIGYHYAIDPAGRVWEGRPIDWQGAHVKYNNEHNLGILMMGNYETQRPTERQLAALKQLLKSRATAYNVRPNRIYTHRELRPTACPGRYLQPRIAAIRETLV